MKKITTLHWFLLALIIFLLLINLLPVTTYYSTGWYIGLFIGIITSFFILCGVLKLQTPREVFFAEIKQHHLIISIFFLIITSIISSLFLEKRLETYIQKHGTKAEALIENSNDETHQITTGGRYNRATTNYEVYNLTLLLKTKEGTEYKLLAKDITEQVYYAVSKGEKVRILYLKENPNIFRIIAGEDNLMKFEGKKKEEEDVVKTKEKKELQFSDLEKLILMKDRLILEKYLKSINIHWESTEDPEGIGFVNNNTAEEISVTPKKHGMFYARKIFDDKENYIFGKEKIINKI
jgi:hypothetical protein